MKILRRVGARAALATLRRECMALRFQRVELANENGSLRQRLADLEAEALVLQRANRDLKLRLQTYRREAMGRASVRPWYAPLPGPLKAHALLELDPPRQEGKT
jgi:chromosome segregation ATPase